MGSENTIIPILTSGTLVYRKVIHKQSQISILDKVHTLSCFAMIGAIKSTPQVSLEIVMEIFPLSALRFKESEELKQDHAGYDAILKDMGSSILVREIDYLLPKSKIYLRKNGQLIPLLGNTLCLLSLMG